MGLGGEGLSVGLGGEGLSVGLGGGAVGGLGGRLSMGLGAGGVRFQSASEPFSSPYSIYRG